MALGTQWYFVENGQRVGPVGEEDMRGLIDAGRVGSDTLVWADGMTDWMPLIQSKGAPLLLEVKKASAEANEGWPGAGYAPGAGGGPGKPMGFGEAIASCFGKYVQFWGRASRSEYWYFALFNILLSIAADLVSASTGQRLEALSGLVGLALFLPGLSVTARRLHDTDRSAWWMLLWFIPVIGWIIMIVFLCQKPGPGRNRFG